MYCKNCGSEFKVPGNICTNCGVEAGLGNNFCSVCGKPIDPSIAVCTNCGTQTNMRRASSNSAPKSKLAAGLFGILLGTLGIHNFYLGYTGKAIAQLLITVLSCGVLSVVSFVWGLIEGILILTNENPVDANGVPLRP